MLLRLRGGGDHIRVLERRLLPNEALRVVRWQTGGQRLTDGAFRSELHLIDIPVGLGWRIADLLQRTVRFPGESDVTLVYRPRLLDPGPELGPALSARLVSASPEHPVVAVTP